MEDGRIPKDILYGELALGRRNTGRPHLRYKDVCIRDMKAVDIDTMSWEGLAADRTEWRSALKHNLETGEEKLMAAAADKRARRKETAIHALVFSVISDAAATQQEINEIKNKNIRMYHPWSSLTDGGLYKKCDRQATVELSNGDIMRKPARRGLYLSKHDFVTAVFLSHFPEMCQIYFIELSTIQARKRVVGTYV